MYLEHFDAVESGILVCSMIEVKLSGPGSLPAGSFHRPCAPVLYGRSNWNLSFSLLSKALYRRDLSSLVQLSRGSEYNPDWNTYTAPT